MRILIFTAIFFFTTIIGSFLHELGHYTSAILLGHRAVPYISHTIYKYQLPDEFKDRPLDEINIQLLEQKMNYHSYLMSLGGVLQTVITGLMGFILLIFLGRPKDSSYLGWRIFGLCATFFLFRSIFIFFDFIFLNKENFKSDEVEIGNYLNLPVGLIPSLLGISALLICCISFTFYFPKTLHQPCLLGLGIGGTAGMFLLYII